MKNYKIQRKTAQIAGIWYLAFIIAGVCGEFMLAAESFPYIKIALSAAGYVCFISAVFMLFKLLRSVNLALAVIMLSLVIAGITVSYLPDVKIFSQIFWGLWLLPLGTLVLKSKIMPKIIGILLFIGGICHLGDFLIQYFFPADVEGAVMMMCYAGAMLAEFSLVAYLLIKDIRNFKCKSEEEKS